MAKNDKKQDIPVDEQDVTGNQQPTGNETAKAQESEADTPQTGEPENVQQEQETDSNSGQQGNDTSKDGEQSADVAAQAESPTNGAQGGENDNKLTSQNLPKASDMPAPEPPVVETETKDGEAVSDKDMQAAANIVSAIAALAKHESSATTEKRRQIAADVFEKNTGLNVLYFTSDLVPFGTESDANRHAASLKNQLVTPTKREA